MKQKHYLEFSDEEQTSICLEFRDEYYPETGLLLIGTAFAHINPPIEKTENGYDVWDAYRSRFEKFLQSYL